MKLLIQSNRIVATATDDYTGPDTHITAPDGFDLARMGEYQVAPDALVIPAKPLSHVDFMDRFTDEEMEAIYAAAAASVKVQVWLDRFRMSSFVDVTDPRTVAGVFALEAAGLLATGQKGSGRAEEVLAAPAAVVLPIPMVAAEDPQLPPEPAPAAVDAPLAEDLEAQPVGPDTLIAPAPETVQ